MVFRRFLGLSLVLVLVSTGAAACGGGDRPTQVAAGGDPTLTTAATDPATTATTDAAPSTTVAPAAPATTTSTSVAPPAGPSAASPVEGLDAQELKAAVEAPVGRAVRSAGGPTVDRVTLPDGTTVWRVRVPGTFPARSARVAISVGGRVVGEGVLASDLQSLTAVTTDGAGLTAGRTVSYQWEGGPSVPAGTLAVIR